VYLKKHIDLTNVVGAGLFAAMVTLAYWGEIDPRGILLFCLVTGISESMVYFRWRLSVVCKLCGFDPVIYKRSPDQAALQVRRFFEEQVENPQFHLSKSPLLELHRRQKARERKQMELRSMIVRSKLPVVDPGP
jgi:hypothetical protein